MTKQNRAENRDEVLFAFHRAHTRPTAEQIIEWVERYPEFAEDIRAHAAVALEWETESHCYVEADESAIAAAYSRALNLIFKAESDENAPAESFQDIIAARGLTVPKVAQEVNIKRGIVADLVSGRMSGPIKDVFVNAINKVLNIHRNTFYSALEYALAHPKLGQAKADSAPSSFARPYEEIIRSSSELTSAEKRHWLEEK
jgi:hypothetical protein